MRRIGLHAAAPLAALHAAATGPQLRRESTGEHHRYEPGPVARVLRKIFSACSSAERRKAVAARLEGNLAEVERMEREAQWLRAHGSPLRVLGLPEHAELDEVRGRYKDLLFETHPDTAIAVAMRHRQLAEKRRVEADAALRTGTTGRLDLMSEDERRAARAAREAAAAKQVSDTETGPTGVVAPAAPVPPAAEAMQPTDADISAAAGTGGAVKSMAAAVAETGNVSEATLRKHQQESFELLQEAYRMAITPTSVWHLNGANTDLLAELEPERRATLLARVADPTNLFALFSYFCLAVAAVIFTLLVAPVVLEGALQLFDPRFYAFMKRQEAKEQELREAGLPVNTDPKRLAPAQVKNLLFPGKLLTHRREAEGEYATPLPPPSAEEVAASESTA